MDGHTLQSQPMTPTYSHPREKRRISFVSYNDLVQSVPTTISPLSEIANGHIEPDHLPGTVSPVRASSPYLDPSNSHHGVNPRGLGMQRASDPNLGHSGRGRVGADRTHGLNKAPQIQSGDHGQHSLANPSQSLWTPSGTDWQLWMNDPSVQRFLDKAKSNDSHAKTAEQDLEEDLIRAVEALVPVNTETNRGLVVLKRLEFDRLHEEGAWTRSIPHNDLDSFVTQRIDEDAKGSDSNSNTYVAPHSATSSGLGLYTPPRFVGWRNGGATHVASVVDVKWVKKGEEGSPASWSKRHREGLAQNLWCLYVGNTLCNTRLGLLLVNDRFQRLAVSPEGHYLIEVRPDHPRIGQTITDFEDCLFGKTELSNRLPRRGDLPEPRTPQWKAMQRLWKFNNVGLAISQQESIRNICQQSLRSDGSRVAAPDNVASGLDKQTTYTILQHTATFRSAVKEEKRRRKTGEVRSDDLSKDGDRRGGPVQANHGIDAVHPTTESGQEHDTDDDISDNDWGVNPVELIRKKMLLGLMVVRLVSSEVIDENDELLVSEIV